LKSLIKVKDSVRFRYIPYEMVCMFDALLSMGRHQGVQPIITGAADEDYPEGKVHAEGYALDVSTSNLSDPDAFARGLRVYLGAVGPHYLVLYGDEEHKNHIHVGFAWYYARRLR